MTISKYKIVEANTRRSCLIPRGKYSIKYEKGKIIKAIPGSLGIFVFDYPYNAKEWQKDLLLAFGIDCIGIKVKPIGRKKKPPKRIIAIGDSDLRTNINLISRFINIATKNNGFYDFNNFFENKKSVIPEFMISPPEATSLYDAIKVLE